MKESLNEVDATVESDGIRCVISGLSNDPITKYHMSSGKFYELSVLRMLSTMVSKGEYDGGWIVDGGSNVGNHTLYWGNALPKLSVVSFEMNPVTFAFLKRNVDASRLSNVVLVNQGLSDKGGKCGVRTVSDNPLGGAQLDFRKQEGNVQLTTVDEFAQSTECPEGKCRLIKLDVEGHEVQALKGSIATLQSDRPIVYVEVKEVDGFDEIVDLLKEIGYVVVDAAPGALPNFIFLPRERFFDYYEPDEVFAILRGLNRRIVQAWQLHREIKKLRRC